MDNKRLDLSELNRQVLLSPGQCGKNPTLNLLEIEDPSLAFLCPLAKAIYLIQTNRLDQVDAKQALSTCFLIDDTFSGDCLATYSWGDDYECAGVSEEVSHSIEMDLCGNSYKLGFRSTGGITWHQPFWDDYLREIKPMNWRIDLLNDEKSSEFFEDIFHQLDSKAQKAPRAYPEDEGEEIAGVEYTLVKINELAVGGPTFYNDKCLKEWRGLSRIYLQRYPNTTGDDEGQMCWLHYIDETQAKLLGLHYGNAFAHETEYPKWIPGSALLEELELTWISPDDLQESYSRGDLLDIQKSTSAWFAFGSGRDWRPGQNCFNDDELDEEIEHENIFNTKTAPLLQVKVNRNESIIPDELNELKDTIERLIRLAQEEDSMKKISD